jgi:ABC-2 type transport system permease protein
VTLVRIAFRLGRPGAIAAAALATVGAIAQPLAFATLAGNTPAERALFGQQMELLAGQLTYLLPLPHGLGTMAGWIEWRALGFLEVVVGFWAVMAASGAGRGDEERGLVEHWLAQGVSRGRYIASRIVTFAVLASVVAALAVTAAFVGAAIVNDAVPAGALALQGIALVGLVLCCYAVALLAAQLVTTRRGAATLGGAVLLVLYLIDVVDRNHGAVEAVRALSPFWLYDQNHPLTAGGALDFPKTLALFVAAAAITTLAVAAFVRRDIGGPLLRPTPRDHRPTTRPAADPLLRLPVLALLDQQRVSLVAWIAAVAALGLFFLSFTRTLVDAMLATPSFRVYLERAGMTSYTAFIGLSWFSALVLLVSLYAIVQANGWAADDQEGRLEVFTAQPISRLRVVVERLTALLLGAAVIVAASSLALLIGAAAADIPLETGRVVLGTALTLLVAFAFGGLGAAGAGWRPRLALGILATVAIVGYFVQELAPLFQWPDWVANLSVYALYGSPVMGSIDWTREATLLAIGVAASLVALAAMQRRDIGA